MFRLRWRPAAVVALVVLALLSPVSFSGTPRPTEARTTQSCDGLLEALKVRAVGLGAAAGVVGGVASLPEARALLVGVRDDTTGEYGATAKAAAANAISQIDACLNTLNAPAPAPQPPSDAVPAVPAPVPGDLRNAPKESPAAGQPGPTQPTPLVPFAEQGGPPRSGGAGGAAAGSTTSPTSPGNARLLQDPGGLDFTRPVTFLRPREATLPVPAQSRAAIGPARPLDASGPAPTVQRIDRTSGNLAPFSDGQARDGDMLQLGPNTALPFTLRGSDGKLATGTVVATGTATVTFGAQETAWDRLVRMLAANRGETPLSPPAMIGITGSANLRWLVQSDGVPPPPIIVTASPNPAGRPSNVVVELYREVVGPSSTVGGRGSSLESANRLLDHAAAYIRAGDREVAIYLTGKMEVQKPPPDHLSFVDIRLQQALGASTTIYTPGQSVRDKETVFSVEHTDANGRDRTTIVVTEGSVIVRDLASGRERTVTAGNTDVFEPESSTGTADDSSRVPVPIIVGAVAATLIAVAGVGALAVRSRRRRT